MCFPVAALGMTAAQTLMTGLAVATSAASFVAADRQAKAQQKLINQQSAIQADEIARAAGQELTQQAMAARRERAEMRAAASQSGINLNSGSFLDALQASSQTQENNMGLIIQNERAQQRARGANTQSLLNQNARPSPLLGALSVASAGVGAYQGSKKAADRGTTKTTG